MIIARQHASLQLPNPVPALRQCQIRLARQVAFEAAFIELLLVKTSECRRQTTKRPDQLELRSNDRNDEAESRLMCKLETLLGFTLRFGQRISRCEKICIHVVAAGDALAETQGEAEQGLEFAHKARFGLVIAIITAQLQLIRTLRGLTPAF